MTLIVRHNDESVREGYIRNGGKAVKLFTSALKAFQCNDHIVMLQMKHLDDFLRGKIIGRLKCGRTQRSSATGKTVSRQTVYRRLGQIGLYARRPVRWVLITATHVRLRLTWSREHVLWTLQQWSCVMFSDESRFSLQSDSRRTLIESARYTLPPREPHHYGGAR
ncbi:transposable element Tcb1 transposase [Trichonephila clavipes]|nr:transposable element Tcb1 transposase [Trichonephila clavipes]